MAYSSITKMRRKKTEQRLIHEINVTPFVDVMLVLLIVFMVTSPMLSSGVTIDLPNAQSEPIASTKSPVTISITQKGELYLENQKMTQASLLDALNQAIDDQATTPIYIKGDQRIDYGVVVGIITLLTNEGFSRVSLMTDPSVIR